MLNPDGTRQDHFTNRRFPHVRGIVLSLLALESSLADRPFWRDRLTLDRDPERSGDTDQIAGACLLLRRLALDGVGLFDEGFHYWFEDTDLCYRVKRAGWRIVYMANASVVHHGSASLNRIDESERAEMFIKSLMYFFRKNRGLLATVGLRISLALVILYRAAWIVAHRPVAGVHQREASCGALRACLGMVRVVFGGSG